MRILVFYQYFGTPNGGWSTRYYEFTRRWVKKGHQVTVVTAPYYKSDIKADGLISRQSVEGVNLIVVNAPDSNKDSFLKRAFNALKFAFISIYFALKEPHDLVLSSSGPITTAIPGLISKKFRSKKFVFEVRDLWPAGGIQLGKINNLFAQKIALSFEKLIYKNSDLVVACSVGMEDGVKKVNPDKPTLVIPNSSDVVLFSSITDRPSGFKSEWENTCNFIYAGSLGLMDECEQIIKGFIDSRMEGIHMFFLGDGAERNHLETLAKQNGLQENIHFMGLLPKKELVKWFQAARASFVTFKNIEVLHTNSPNKLFDSFAAGIPVIQSTKGWIATLVNESNCGINVDPEDPKSMAEAILYLRDNPTIAEEMGGNAKKLAIERFNRDHLSEIFLKGLIDTLG
ncbi:glycosyltransferase family 4 protein [Algoriphagus machipongonensis]|uniref:Glycosyl transferase n=1 Tax=Algoriphagus machipongonensis TaxID=388413 RepID=A3I1Z7_9BACT|nr:glycosyltransferase family 4 protein [Algoriphagus machipongonensis]EAZ79813.1 glycosyl transferase [Algoriphagus machipongonensis]